jgi:hypothetical protein
MGRQRGTAMLLFALIVLVILLIGGIAVIRSINASLFGAGNLAFRRDVVTQSDAAIACAIQAVAARGSSGSTGICKNSPITELQTSAIGRNYSATILPVNAEGIPAALLTETDFVSVGDIANDIVVDKASKVTIRYLIERMCDTAGPVSSAHCVQIEDSINHSVSGTNYSYGKNPPSVSGNGTIYRVSARVSGPRDTQAFFQTMFTGPN